LKCTNNDGVMMVNYYCNNQNQDLDPICQVAFFFHCGLTCWFLRVSTSAFVHKWKKSNNGVFDEWRCMLTREPLLIMSANI